MEVESTRNARGRIVRFLALFCLAVPLILSSVASPLRVEAAEKSKKQRAKIHREAQKAIKDGDFEKAIKLYTGLVEENGQDIQARLGVAFAAIKDQNYQLGYDQSGEALKQDPENSRAHALAGLALLRSGYLAVAAQQLSRALALNPKEAIAHGAAAEIDYFEGRLRDSRARAMQAYRLAPNEPDYLITIARSSARIELFAEAAQAYELFLDTLPKSDTERRDRVRGLIQLYRRLTGLKIH
ncbi:MAG TPA: tetratricopeptide repeat protein, partial [Blastocatellia bacterium]|nr:tetratricopeptide repeat protein [Blastocatellia bacterium]